MTTINRKLTTPLNCASYGWHEGAWYFIPGPTDLDLGYVIATTYLQGNALRFENINIPPGQVIKNAFLTYFSWSTYTVDDCNAYIYGEKSLTPPQFSTWANFQARPKTINRIPWDKIAHWSLNQPYQSPNISPIIQEIITQPGWASGNPIVLFCDDLEDRSSHIDFAYRHAWAYYEHFQWAAELTIEFGPEKNFAPLTIGYEPTPTTEVIKLTTQIPCHLTCYWTDKKPQRHPLSRVVRGLEVPWSTYFCFVAWHAVEQNEPGDTLTHTFDLVNWLSCQTRWFTFRGTTINVLSPSVGPIFEKHKTLGDYTIFEYYIAAFDTGLYTSATVILAQTFTPQIPHQIAEVILLLRRVGLPGIMTIEIQGTTLAGFPDDVNLTSGTFNADDLPVGPPPVAAWKTIPIDLYELAAGTTYAIVLYGGDDANRVGWNAHTPDPYPRGKACYWRPAPWFWFNAYGWDFLFEELGYAT